MGAKCSFVGNLFDVNLDEGEGFLNVPGPEGWVEGLPADPLLGRAMPTQDVTDGVRGR